ncbi:MAG: hypothetical protein ACFCD0_27310 [Gemmataceae bacterium]
MVNPNTTDRLRKAITEAAENLKRHSEKPLDHDTPTPGDLYVFDLGEDVCVEWLVVRFHPDNEGFVLLAPADDFPLVGTPDVRLSREELGRPLVVRCGETDWFPASICVPRLRTDVAPESDLKSVRQRLADLARGRTLDTTDESVDLDPEYQDWLEDIAQARDQLLARVENIPEEVGEVVPMSRFLEGQPSELTSTPDYSLAAESGGEFFAELSEALADTSDVQHHEVPDFPDGKLFLVADANGVSGLWSGTVESAPPLSGFDASGQAFVTSWVSGPEGRLHKTDKSFPWIDGQVVVEVGSTPPRKLAVRV